MIRTFVEEIYHAHYSDEPSNEEVLFYYNKLHEDIKLFAAPQHKDEVEGHFYGIICGLCRASELKAFKHGLTHALKLAAECSTPSDLSAMEARNDYREMYREEAKRSEELRKREVKTNNIEAIVKRLSTLPKEEFAKINALIENLFKEETEEYSHE